MPNNPDDSGIAQPGQCPRCHRNKLFHLKSMRNHDSRDWFKCDGCEHIFTTEPVVEATPQLLAVSETELH